MDFGKLQNIGKIDFALPPDHHMTGEFPAAVKPGNKALPAAYVGCPQWGRKDWIGKLYPPGTKERDFLQQYARNFNCVEMNALFYNLQPKQVIERWASLAGDGFRFCPKYSNSISHLRQLQNARRETDQYIDHMLHFGQKLGPCFLQLSEGFGPDRATVLQDYLRSLPRDFSTSVELRHPDWFKKGRAAEETWQALGELGIGAVITDVSGRRDCLHMRLTSPIAFIRFVGNNLHPTDFTRIDDWVTRIRGWFDKGLREVYFFVHNSEEVNSPQLCHYAVTQINRQCGLSLKPPKLWKDGTWSVPTLFD